MKKKLVLVEWRDITHFTVWRNCDDPLEYEDTLLVRSVGWVLPTKDRRVLALSSMIAGEQTGDTQLIPVSNIVSKRTLDG